MASYLELFQEVQQLIFHKKSIDIFPNGLFGNSNLYQELQNDDQIIQKQVIQLLNDLNVSEHKSDLFKKLEQFKILQEEQILIKEDIEKKFIQLKQKQAYIIDQKDNLILISDNLLKATSQIQNQIDEEKTLGNNSTNQINMECIRYMRCKLGTAEATAGRIIAKLLYMIRNDQLSPEVAYYNAFNLQQQQLDELKVWLCDHQLLSNQPNIIEAASQIFNSLDENKYQNFCPLIRLYYDYFKSRFKIIDIQNSRLGLLEQLEKTQQSTKFLESQPDLNHQISQIRSEIEQLNLQQNVLERQIKLIRENQILFEQHKLILEFSEFGYQKFNFLRYNLFAEIQKIVHEHNLDHEIQQEIEKMLQMDFTLNYLEILKSKSIYSYKDTILKSLTQSKENINQITSAIYNPQSIITSLIKLKQNIQESQFSVKVLFIAFNIEENGLILKNNLNFIKIFSAELNKYQKGKMFEKLQQQQVFKILNFDGQNISTLQLYHKLLEQLDIPKFLEILQYREMIMLFLSELFIKEVIKPQFQKIDIGSIVNQMKHAPLDKILLIFKQSFLFFSNQQKYYKIVQQSIHNQNNEINSLLNLKKQKEYNINFAKQSLEQIKALQCQIESVSKILSDQIERLNQQSQQIVIFKQKQIKGRDKPIFCDLKTSSFDYLKKSPLNNRSELLIYKVLMIFLSNDQFSQDSIKSILSSNKGQNRLKQIQAQDIDIMNNQQLDQIKIELKNNEDSLAFLNRNTKKLWRKIKKIDIINFKNLQFENLLTKQQQITKQLKNFEKLNKFTIQLFQKDLREIYELVNQYQKQQILEYNKIMNQKAAEIKNIHTHKYNSKDVKQLLDSLVYLEETKIIRYSQELTNFLIGQSSYDQNVIDFLLYYKNFSNIDISNNKLGTILKYLDHYYLINEQYIKHINNEICVIQQQDIQQILLYQNFVQNFNCSLNQLIGVYTYINLYQYEFKSTLQTIIQVEQQINKNVDSIKSDLITQISIIYKILSKLIEKKYVLGIIADFLKQIQQLRQQVQTIYDIIKFDIQFRLELTQNITINQFQKQISDILNIQLTGQIQLE